MKIKSFRENIMITFDEKNKVFYLSTEKTSYIIGLLNGELPIHIHWGKRIDRIPDDWEKPTHDVRFPLMIAGNFPQTRCRRNTRLSAMRIIAFRRCRFPPV